MKEIKILITDANYKYSLGIVRQLGKDGFKNIFCLTEKKYSLSFFSKYCKEELILNRNYTCKELGEICKQKNITFIIIVGTNSFKKIVPCKEILEKYGVYFVSVDEEKLNIAFSKKATYKVAEKIGIPIAKTFYPTTFDDLNSIKDNIQYPCVIKGLYEVGGNIVDYAYKKEELEKKYINICEKFNLKENELPMIQEYIDGFGCGFFAVYSHGKCGLTFQHKRIREYPVSGGASVCAESYKNSKVEEYGKKLLDVLHWHGVAMVEFKMNKDGIPILMEINPKFWGSTDLALEAGVNFPKALIDIHLNKEIEYSDKYKIPLRYHWPLQGDICHGIDNPKAILPIIVDILNPKVKSNLWLSDILPAFKMFLDFTKIIIIKMIRRKSDI